jgi:hypothetical protein
MQAGVRDVQGKSYQNSRIYVQIICNRVHSYYSTCICNFYHVHTTLSPHPQADMAEALGGMCYMTLNHGGGCGDSAERKDAQPGAVQCSAV